MKRYLYPSSIILIAMRYFKLLREKKRAWCGGQVGQLLHSCIILHQISEVIMFLELLILSPIYVLLPPIFFIISITLFLAVIGQSLGVRRLYIDFLLKVFEVNHNERKKYFLQFAHNSKEKKDHDGAQIGGFFVGKEIPDSDSSEEGDQHRNDQWTMSVKLSKCYVAHYEVRIY